jgi:hypothetical protein
VELTVYAQCWGIEIKHVREFMMAKRATKKAAPKKSAAKRELIAPRGAKRYIRRAAAGRIKESDDVSRSLSQDRRRKAKTAAKPGQGDRGDRKSGSKRTSRKNRVPGYRRTLDLFGDSALPEGFRYQPEFLNAGESAPSCNASRSCPSGSSSFMASPESGGSCHSDGGTISTEAD